MWSIITKAAFVCSSLSIENEPSEKVSLIALTLTLPLLTAIRISSISESAFREALLVGSNSGVINNVEGNSSSSLVSSSS